MAPVVGFSASVNNTTWTNTETRPTSPLTEIQTTLFSTAGTSLYVRLFANKTSGSGTVNVLKYKAYMQKVPTDSSGGVLNSAYAFTNGVGTPVNCSLSVVGGKTRVTLTWQYPVGINVGTPFGSIDVYLNGQLIPRYINATLTPNASFTEVSSTAIDLDSNYSAVNVSVEILQRAAIVDQSSQNSTYIAQNTASISAINSNISLLPTIQRFTSGSGTYYPTYAFIVAGTANVTAGATYTNNSVTFTALTTSSASGSVYFIGTGAPTSSGNLIKSSGTGDSVISFSSYKKPKHILVKMVGGGGGGAGAAALGSGGSGQANGGSGGNTLWQTFGGGITILQANGGTGGKTHDLGLASGGTVTVNSPAIQIVGMQGTDGGAYQMSRTGQDLCGGNGGTSFFGGAGAGGSPQNAGIAGSAGKANSGSGGGGAAFVNVGNVYSGGGGASGGYIEALILNPSSSYSYSVGVAGTAGNGAGGGLSAGSAGGSGQIIVEEYYV